jgi:hypothetical protein
MSKLFYFIASALLIFSLVASGQSSDQRAHGRAANLLEQHNSLAADLTFTGSPTAHWNKDEINTYEIKINTLESIELELTGLHAAYGIEINSADNSSFISNARIAIAKARTAKSERASI